MPGRGQAALRGSGKSPGCPLGEFLRLLGKPHVLNLLHLFTETPGPLRFVDLQKRLEISPNTLSARLHELVSAGFLTRTSYNEIPPRVDYETTAKTKELEEVFEQLGAWARRNDLRPQPFTGTRATMSAQMAKT